MTFEALIFKLPDIKANELKSESREDRSIVQSCLFSLVQNVLAKSQKTFKQGILGPLQSILEPLSRASLFHICLQNYSHIIVEEFLHPTVVKKYMVLSYQLSVTTTPSIVRRSSVLFVQLGSKLSVVNLKGYCSRYWKMSPT